MVQKRKNKIIFDTNNKPLILPLGLHPSYFTRLKTGDYNVLLILQKKGRVSRYYCVKNKIIPYIKRLKAYGHVKPVNKSKTTNNYYYKITQTGYIALRLLFPHRYPMEYEKEPNLVPNLFRDDGFS